MLTHGILNAQLAADLAGLRHKDRFVISDCGLPDPPGIEVVDLALVFGVPRFEDVLDALKDDLTLESALMACEVKGHAPERWVRDRFDLPVSFVPHDGPHGFKAAVEGVKFIVRTGETTSFANVIFQCGVPF